jgi:aminoglycoside phosphotransferase (APT) family kinase protein
LSFIDNNSIFKLRIENKYNNRRSLLQNEAESLKLLDSLELGIPHPHLFTIKEDTSKRLFTVQSYVSGIPITDVISVNERYKHYTKIGDCLKHIHSIYNSQCGRLVSLKNIPWRDNFMDHFIADSEDAKAFLPKALMKDIHSQVVSVLDSITSCPRLLHGDLHPGNMIINKDFVSMIDFQHCLFGDPLFDIAQFYIRMLRYENAPDTATKALIKGLKYKEINMKTIRIYIFAIFVNEVAFSSQIKKKKRVDFYSQELLKFWDAREGLCNE